MARSFQFDLPTVGAGPPRLLFVVHAFGFAGGVENHTRTLANAIRDDFSCSFAYPEPHRFVLINEFGHESSFPVSASGFAAEADRPRALAKLLQAAAPNLIHVQHWLHWHSGVLDQLADSGLPCVVSFHDYYALSPDFTLMDLPLEVPPQAVFSLQGPHGEALRRTLSRMSARIAPSRYLQQILNDSFTLPVECIEYGIELFCAKRRKSDDGALRFGFLGALIPQKGWEVLIKAFAETRQSFPKSRLLLFGEAPGIFPANEHGILYAGSYRSENLPRIFEQIDVGVIPSLFRETYCLVLSEFRQAGIPVIASDVGALKGRIRDGIDGKLVAPGNVEQLAACMNWFCSSRAWHTWNIPHPNSDLTMGRDYLSVYRSALSGSSPLPESSARNAAMS